MDDSIALWNVEQELNRIEDGTLRGPRLKFARVHFYSGLFRTLEKYELLKVRVVDGKWIEICFVQVICLK